MPPPNSRTTAPTATGIRSPASVRPSRTRSLGTDRRVKLGCRPMGIASTTSGKVQGLEKDGVLQFRGLRYATATRFQPPQPAEPWADVLDARSFGPILP